MTDYKRMVSYMYQYENGIKKKNVGYVRVEVKNGQCKFTIHMQLLGQSDSIFPTYLIHRKGSSLDLIYLGDSILRMQLMDSRLITDEANIMDSGYNLTQMSGVLIFMNNNIFFATVWDDKALNADELLEAMKPSNNTNKNNNRQMANDNDFSMKSRVKDYSVEDREVIKTKPELSTNDFYNESRDKTEILQKAKVDVKHEDRDSLDYEAQEHRDKLAEETDAYEEKLSLEEELKIPTYKLPGGLKTIEMFRRSMAVAEKVSGSDRDEKTEAEANTEAIPASSSNISQSEISNDSKTSVMKAGSKTSDKSDVSKTSDTEADSKASDKSDVSKTSDTEVDRKISDIKIDYKTSDAEADVERSVELERLMTRFNRLYPFEDNEILLCVKIEPKDIGILPKQLWPLSNNSFLLHGFYCYHHLILAKMKYRDKAVYILGVPGLYQHREQFMARMFGFDSFKSIKKREPKKGDFGYWYLQINC